MVGIVVVFSVGIGFMVVGGIIRNRLVIGICSEVMVEM